MFHVEHLGGAEGSGQAAPARPRAHTTGDGLTGCPRPTFHVKRNPANAATRRPKPAPPPRTSGG